MGHVVMGYLYNTTSSLHARARIYIFPVIFIRDRRIPFPMVAVNGLLQIDTSNVPFLQLLKKRH